MTSRDAPRIYVKSVGSAFARLFWFKSNRPNELLLGAYSLNGTPASITHEFPEKGWSPGDPSEMDVHWSEATSVCLPIDHFTCHADGRFHAKTHQGKPLYSHHEQGSPLGPDSPVFLDLIIASDVISKYRVLNSPPKYPHVWFQASPDATLSLNAIFSGARYPILDDAIRTGRARPGMSGGVVMTSGTIQCVIWGAPLSISAEARSLRPPGTLFVFQWRRGGRTVGAKSFILN